MQKIKKHRGRRVLFAGALLLAAGIALWAHAQAPEKLTDTQRQALVAEAESYQGTPYESEAFTCPGIGPGLCAGYVRRVYLDVLGGERGEIGRTTAEQKAELADRAAHFDGRYLSGGALKRNGAYLDVGAMGIKPGDLIYFDECTGSARHVGMYVGETDGVPWMIDNNANGGVGKRPLTVTIGREGDPYEAVAVYCNP